MLLSVALPITTQTVIAEAVSPPVAAKKPAVLEKFGDKRVDEFHLDVNELAKGHHYTSVGLMDVTPDATKLAYTVDFTGFRQYTLHVKDLESGHLLRDTAARVTSIAWAGDSKTIFYVEEHET